ncbi:MAG: GH23 [uncultured Rubrobacteraceae bacterium]|uniref:GH23 n=1 Tax=uncultured Rubrobacteraceae bacterium TaxID=349277 RepID=A0A6J4R3Y8_9ACTN|nr:MAG: GH23 [uncultured Rubrobacteraceae bacterium]
MSGGQFKVSAILGVLSLAFMCAGAAEAQGPARGATEDTTIAGSERMPMLEAKISDQDAALRDSIREISTVGAELDRAQSRADSARARVGDLGRQTRHLKRQIAEQDAAFREAQARYREQALAAYKGGSLEGLADMLDGWFFGSWQGVAGADDPVVARILLDSRQDLAAFQESRQTLKNTQRQISQKRRDYNAAMREHRVRTEDLRRREQDLDESIDRLSTNNARTEARLHKLEAAERAHIQKRSAATGWGEVNSRYEREVARNEIVARDVDPTSRNQYMDLYRESAEAYGFGPDWYVLAAVGKVESNHGESMGPSSAGAMGPMQFMPSTWETSGVDGDGDGVANIMDPEDAIPAAASYLKDGGAPQDWYRALYSYNHADWYVKKVLAVAEAYRRLAKDESVGPYV